MGARYRRNLNDGDTVSPAKPFKLDATYAATAKRWDVVKLNTSGDVVAAASADTSILGVLETVELKIQGDSDTGAVRIAAGAIYEMPVTGGTPVTGKAYGITNTDGGTVNVADTTTTVVKVVAVRTNGNVDVVFTGRQLV